MRTRKGAKGFRIADMPEVLARKIKIMGEELFLTRAQIVERALVSYVQDGCKSLIYRLSEIDERKKNAERIRLENKRMREARLANPGRPVGRPKKIRLPEEEKPKKKKPFNGLW